MLSRVYIFEASICAYYPVSDLMPFSLALRKASLHRSIYPFHSVIVLPY